MIVIEIAFVLVNLAVPYWLWTKKSTTSNLPVVEREALHRAVFRAVEASGGFPPCSSQEVTDAVIDLCDQSQTKWTEKESTAFERAGHDVVFSCEVLKNDVKVLWHPEQAPDHDMDCGSSSDLQIAYAPAFTYNLKGQLRTITYTTPEGTRAVAPIMNCRRKLAAAKGMAARMPASRGDFLHALPRLKADPADHVTRNQICLLFDPSEEWEMFRKRYEE